jgi:hypothetical protein
MAVRTSLFFSRRYRRAFIQAEGTGRPLSSRFERLRGMATTCLGTGEIMALTRGEAA